MSKKFKTVKSKSGKVYVYEASKYKYKHKSTRGLTLVGKNGRIDKKNIQKFKDTIDANKSYTAAEKRYLKADLDAMVAQKHKANQKLTTTGFLGHLESNKISKMFTNAGYSIPEVVAEYGMSEAELLDPKNWAGNEFTIGGKTLTFNFTYQGDIFV
jgi:hypothetical protein